jgi:hypothetical protein
MSETNLATDENENELKNSMQETLSEIKGRDDSSAEENNSTNEEDSSNENEQSTEESGGAKRKAGDSNGESGESTDGDDEGGDGDDSGGTEDDADGESGGVQSESEESGSSETSEEDLDEEDEGGGSDANADDNRPPSTWRPAAKDKWDKLDPVIKTEIKKREHDMMAGAAALKTKAQSFDAINGILQPYEPLMRSKGVHAGQVLTSMLNTYYKLESSSPEEKKQLILGLSQHYGIDLGGNTAQNNNQSDTANNPLHAKVVNLEQQLNNQNLEKQQTARQTALAEVEQFAADVDETGALKHPYFENVRTEMAQ